MKILIYQVMIFLCLGGLSACQTIDKSVLYYPDEIKSKNDLIVEYSKAYRVLDYYKLIGGRNSKDSNK